MKSNCDSQPVIHCLSHTTPHIERRVIMRCLRATIWKRGGHRSRQSHREHGWEQTQSVGRCLALLGSKAYPCLFWTTGRDAALHADPHVLPASGTLRRRFARIHTAWTMQTYGWSSEEMDTAAQYVAAASGRVEPAHEHSRQVTRADRRVFLWHSLSTLYVVMYAYQSDV